MNYIHIYNFETDEMKTFSFNSLLEAEHFAADYKASEDEEISIGNEFTAMLLEDYYCL